jgi:hypothetical protein
MAGWQSITGPGSALASRKLGSFAGITPPDNDDTSYTAFQFLPFLRLIDHVNLTPTKFLRSDWRMI